MVRTCNLVSGLVITICLATSAMASEERSSTEPEAKPIQRGYGQHDACFGDKYERDEDLKTGNELAVEEILKLLTQPGT